MVLARIQYITILDACNSAAPIPTVCTTAIQLTFWVILEALSDGLMFASD